MSDETSAPKQGGQGEAQASQTGHTPPDDGFHPITSQEDFEKRLGERLARERQKFADYGELKKKAEAFDKHEEANKTELQKAQEALEAARSETAQVRLQGAKSELKAALAPVLPEADAFVEDLDIKRFLGDDGSLAVDAVKGLVDRYAQLGPRRPAPDRSQASGGASGLDGAALSPADQFASFIKGQMGAS